MKVEQELQYHFTHNVSNLRLNCCLKFGTLHRLHVCVNMHLVVISLWGKTVAVTTCLSLPILITDVNNPWATYCVTLRETHVGKLMAAKLEYVSRHLPLPSKRTHARAHTRTHTQTFPFTKNSWPCSSSSLSRKWPWRWILQTLNVVSLCWLQVERMGYC
jgi:hypothetical protein